MIESQAPLTDQAEFFRWINQTCRIVSANTRSLWQQYDELQKQVGQAQEALDTVVLEIQEYTYLKQQKEEEIARFNEFMKEHKREFERLQSMKGV